MTSTIDICNRSLLSVGARAQISSLNPSDGSVEADACSVLFTPTFEALARTAQWNCLTKQRTLSLIAAAQGTPENPDGTSLPLPPTPWLYSYAYPSDCLAFRFVVPSYPVQEGDTPPPTTINNAAGAWIPNGGQIPFVVSSANDANNAPIEIILTNQSQAQGVYTANIPNPAIWDSLFQAAMVASLAAYLVPALSLSLPLMDRSIASAERCIAQARASDGNEGVTVMDHLPDWMQARWGGQGLGYGTGWNFSIWGGYVNNMVWPTAYYG
jgi:hypothetical protein